MSSVKPGGQRSTSADWLRSGFPYVLYFLITPDPIRLRIIMSVIGVFSEEADETRGGWSHVICSPLANRSPIRTASYAGYVLYKVAAGLFIAFLAGKMILISYG
jgi:hypothetical protein